MEKVVDLRKNKNKKNVLAQEKRAQSSVAVSQNRVHRMNKKSIPRPIYWEVTKKRDPNSGYGLFFFFILLIIFSGFAMLFQQNILAVITFFAIAVVVLLRRSSGDIRNQYEISIEGITVNGKQYPLDELKSFWIEYSSTTRELSLQSNKMFSSYIKLLLGNQNPIEIRKFLIQHLPEKKHEIAFADIMARWLGI